MPGKSTTQADCKGGPIPCPSCFYDLQGQPVPRCPECGLEFDSMPSMREQSANARHFVPEISARRERAAVWLAVGFGFGALAGIPVFIVADRNKLLAEVWVVAVGLIWLVGGAKAAWLILVVLWRSCDRRIHAAERWELLTMVLLLLIYQVPALLGLLLLSLVLPGLLRGGGS